MKRGREVFYKYTVQGTPLQSTCVLRILKDEDSCILLSHAYALGVAQTAQMAGVETGTASGLSSSQDFVDVCDKELSEFLICKE